MWIRKKNTTAFNPSKCKPEVEGEKLTFPRALEKEPNNEHLQPRHCHHHQALDNTEIENPLLSTAHGAEIAVLARPEVLLVPTDCGQLA